MGWHCSFMEKQEKSPSPTEFVYLYKSENNCSGDRWEHKADWKYFYVVQALNSKEDVHWQSMAGCMVFISPSIFFGTGAINKNRAAPSLWSPEEVSWLWKDSVNIRTDAILKGSMSLIMFPCLTSSIYFCLIISNVELVACREGCELKHHCKFLLMEPELQQRNWQLVWERYFQPQAQKMIFF